MCKTLYFTISPLTDLNFYFHGDFVFVFYLFKSLVRFFKALLHVSVFPSALRFQHLCLIVTVAFSLQLLLSFNLDVDAAFVTAGSGVSSSRRLRWVVFGLVVVASVVSPGSPHLSFLSSCLLFCGNSCVHDSFWAK